MQYLFDNPSMIILIIVIIITCLVFFEAFIFPIFRPKLIHKPYYIHYTIGKMNIRICEIKNFNNKRLTIEDYNKFNEKINSTIRYNGEYFADENYEKPCDVCKKYFQKIKDNIKFL